MCEKLWTKVRPPGKEFTAGALGRIATSLAKEYGELARAEVGRDAEGPFLLVVRAPMLRAVPATTQPTRPHPRATDHDREDEQ